MRLHDGADRRASLARASLLTGTARVYRMGGPPKLTCTRNVPLDGLRPEKARSKLSKVD